MIKLHRTGSINLPGEDGVSLPQRVRATQPGIGIIMLTVRSKNVDRTTGYQSGADIYPTKPTSQEELGAALQAASLRLKPPGAVPEQRVLAFTLDMQRFMLAGPQAQVSLNALEATVVSALTSAVWKRLENGLILKLLAKSETSYSKARLEVLIFRLRKKLVQASVEEHAIKVSCQVGYQLGVAVRVV